jgi:hypothetical protein
MDVASSGTEATNRHLLTQPLSSFIHTPCALLQCTPDLPIMNLRSLLQCAIQHESRQKSCCSWQVSDHSRTQPTEIDGHAKQSLWLQTAVMGATPSVECITSLTHNRTLSPDGSPETRGCGPEGTPDMSSTLRVL